MPQIYNSEVCEKSALTFFLLHSVATVVIVVIVVIVVAVVIVTTALQCSEDAESF